MPGQLRCKDLQPGDIMVKVNDGSLVARWFRAGQALFRDKNPGITRAGLMVDSTLIIEAQSDSIVTNDVRVGDLG